MTVSTDVNGAISIPLIPNAGSNPAGTYYKVVIKLDDGTTSEEQWVVPTTSPTTVAAIRAKVVPQAVAAQFVTEQQFFGLATVASTGNYNDLLNKPTLTFNASAPGPIGGTTPSTVNATAVTAQSVNGVLNAATFAGADASVKVNACIAAVIAAGGGTCDASTLGGTQVMGQQINLGNTSLYDSKIVAKLILPAAGAWKWSLTDGVSCGIYQYSNTIIEGTGDVSGALAFTLDTANSATNMDSLYCTNKSPTGGGSYVKATGFDVSNTGAGTLVNGVVDVRYIFDESKFDHIIASNPTGDAWHITSVCCGTTFDQIAGFGSTTPASTGGTPLTVAQGAAFSIKNSSFNGPGIGKHNIYVVGGSNPVTGASFENVYMEKYGATDLGTSMVYVDSNVNGVSSRGAGLVRDAPLRDARRSFLKTTRLGGSASATLALITKLQQGLSMMWRMDVLGLRMVCPLLNMSRMRTTAQDRPMFMACPIQAARLFSRAQPPITILSNQLPARCKLWLGLR